ncbi:MAG: PAS domain S-box protein, partial [Rhodospirillales bacterium]|nr:PAS domain S-box protein [Rhodospirillales bacterium]
MAEAANISTTALRKKIIHVSIVGILLAAILVGVATMVPSFNRLVDAHNEELAHSAELLAQSLDQFVNHSKAIATQSVSQFQARQILVAHGFGDIGASQLRTLVVPVLRAIVEQHDSLLGIVRFDKANRAVVSAGIDIPDIQWPYGAFTSDTALIGQLHETARGLRFTVSIPIMDPNFGRIGTDILLLEAKELLRLLQPTRPSDDQETYLMVLSANGPLFVATSGFTRPEGLGEIDPSTLPDKGFVRVEDTEIGVASVAATGWRVLITTDSSRHDRHLWEDIAKTAFITLLVMAGVGSIVYALMAPLAKGLVVRAESLEAEVIQRTTELNASEERFRGFAEAASDWFWETDTEHRFTYLSAAFESASSHLSADQILGRKRWDIPGAAPVDGDWTEHRAGMDAHDPIVGFEYAIVGADGEKRFLRVNGKPRFDEDGTFLGYRGVGRNITDLRRAEREREKSEKLFLDAISSVPVSIALFDPNDRLVVW